MLFTTGAAPIKNRDLEAPVVVWSFRDAQGLDRLIAGLGRFYCGLSCAHNFSHSRDCRAVGKGFFKRDVSKLANHRPYSKFIKTSNKRFCRGKSYANQACFALHQ